MTSMAEKLYTLSGIYDIPVKRFEPENDITGFIVAAHGFAGDKESSAIALLAERMTERGYAVIAFDFPGHGTSMADGYFCAANSRLDFSNVFKHACDLYPGMKNRAVFATSFGGYITLLSLDILPENVILVLRAPAVDMRATFEKMVPGGIDELRKNRSAVMGYEHKLNIPVRFYDELCDNDISGRCFDRDMLILHGDMDDTVLPEHIQKFCSANPKARLETIAGANHRFKGEGELERVIDLAEKYIAERSGRQ